MYLYLLIFKDYFMIAIIFIMYKHVNMTFKGALCF